MAVHKLIVIETIQRLGRAGQAGAVLLLAGIAAALAVLWPAGLQMDAAATALRAAQARQASGANAMVVEPPAPDQQLKSYYAMLPKPSEAPIWIERIYQIANNEKLPLAKGEYAVQQDPNGRLSKYLVTLPMRGDYPKIRRFIQKAFDTIPVLALEEISLQRQNIAETDVEARLRFSILTARP